MESEIKIVTTDEEYAQAMSVRHRVFVEEYGIPAKKEYDGNDHCSTHLLAVVDGNPVGTMRIRYFNGFVKFERMCVLPAYRKTDCSEQIMQKGMVFAAQKGYRTIYGVCKQELLPRWKKNGFEPIADAPSVEQNGMTLVPVQCPLPDVGQRICLQTSPEILNAKEGQWFESPAEAENSNDILHRNFKEIRHKVHSLLQSGSTPQNVKNAPSAIERIMSDKAKKQCL
jgi:predicted GNAT family N-acyltransferase